MFSFIVIYDAFRLRGDVARHAAILNRLEGSVGLNEAAGHSLGEIAVGVLVGVVWALAASALTG